MLDILQEEEDMLDKMEEDKENENPQKRGEEKKHEDGPKGNYETPKNGIGKLRKTSIPDIEGDAAVRSSRLVRLQQCGECLRS